MKHICVYDKYVFMYHNCEKDSALIENAETKDPLL